MTDAKTPLTLAMEYIFMMIENANGYWSFHVIDLGIEAFKRSFPEQNAQWKQLIDLRADKWHQMFSKFNVA